jgi:hypothetical protein
MTDDIQLRWQRLTESYEGNPLKRGFTYRAEVPGGWLVTVCAGKPGKGQFGGLCFIADAAHEWQLAVDAANVAGSAETVEATRVESAKRKKKNKVKARAASS